MPGSNAAEARPRASNVRDSGSSDGWGAGGRLTTGFDRLGRLPGEGRELDLQLNRNDHRLDDFRAIGGGELETDLAGILVIGRDVVVVLFDALTVMLVMNMVVVIVVVAAAAGMLDDFGFTAAHTVVMVVDVQQLSPEPQDQGEGQQACSANGMSSR